MIELTHPKPKVLGLRLTEVDGKNFYTEEGILSLETGATASIQVSLTNDIGDINQFSIILAISHIPDRLHCRFLVWGYQIARR